MNDSHKLGPTGRFPEGKLTPQDEGELKFFVGVKHGKVVIQFGSPVSWVGMPPEKAMELAQLLVFSAAQATSPPDARPKTQ
jgi:hypothetical protein